MWQVGQIMDRSLDAVAESPDNPRGIDRRRLLAYASATAVAAGAAVAFDTRRASALVSLGETSATVDSIEEALAAAQVTAWGGYANGNIPASALTPVVASVAGSGYLRTDAARQYLSLSLAFSNAIGTPLVITEGYRSYSRQVDYWNLYQAGKGNLAAYPGTSNHGWGISCDFGSGVASAGSAAKRWMDANAPSYGWSPTGNTFSRPEPWHFDYVGNYVGDIPLEVEQDPDVVIIRATQALDEQQAGYAALVGLHSLRHLASLDMINSMRVVGTPFYEVGRSTFYDIMSSMGIPRSALTQNADYWRR